MATRHQPPPAAPAGDDPPAAAGRDDSIGQALARSREIRQKGSRQIQAVRERAAARRRQRSGPGSGSGSGGPAPAARVLDVGQEIERSRQARARLAELAGRLVRTEETAAHIHDEMASRDSGHAAAYRRAADDARRAARRAREIQREAAEPGSR